MVKLSRVKVAAGCWGGQGKALSLDVRNLSQMRRKGHWGPESRKEEDRFPPPGKTNFREG